MQKSRRDKKTPLANVRLLKKFVNRYFINFAYEYMQHINTILVYQKNPRRLVFDGYPVINQILNILVYRKT